MVLVLVPLSQVMVTSQFPNSGDGRNDIQVEGRLSRKAEAARVPVVGGVGALRRHPAAVGDVHH